MTINLATLLGAITIPTPEVYDPEFPHRNQENFYRSMLQILQQLSAISFEIADSEETEKNILVSAIQDLKFNGETLDLGPLQITFTGKTISVSGP